MRPAAPGVRRSSRRRRLLLGGVLLSAVALTGCFGPGIHPVGTPLTSTQMPPGLWRSLGGNQCTWARVRSGGVTAGRNIRTNGPQYMQVEPGDVGAAIGSCVPFWQQPGPFAKPLVQPGSDVSDGDFLVGYEVKPGTYVGSGGSQCTWAAVRGFHGKDSAGNNPDFIRGGSSTTAQIASGDYGFTSQGCGTWHFTSSAPPPPPTTTTTKPPPPPDPVFHADVEDFPDPNVLRVDSASKCGGDPAPCYYAYSTEAGFLGFINVPVIRSPDLVNWKWAGPPAPGQTAARKDAMPTLAPWAAFGGNWAPTVMWNTTLSKYVMYYTAKLAGSSPARECLGMATSTAPDGPYVDNSTQPFLCPNGAGDTIDPSTFVDSGGGLWLQYTDQSAIRTRQLNPDGTLVSGSPAQLLAPLESWESGRVEAPNMIQTDSTGILLFYSGNVFNNAGYAVGVARCTAPGVSCTRIPPGSPILASSDGPGGQSPFQFGDGSWRLAYHAWVGGVGTGVRTLHIANMTFSGTSPNQNPSIG